PPLASNRLTNSTRLRFPINPCPIPNKRRI
ncbi:MAG: hypothetical protein ACI868_001703, partial [Granulosicoccus sp.]